MTHEVLAKSPKKHCGQTQYVTLEQHTQHVLSAADALFGLDEPTSLARSWLRFFRVPQNWAEFRRDLTAACALHDWGKANDSFQQAVRNGKDQAIRHEHLSALLLGLPCVETWLREASIDYPLVLSCVLTHHLKASSRADGFGQMPGQPVFHLVNDGNGFQKTIDVTASRLGIATVSWDQLPKSWTANRGRTQVRRIRRQIQDDVLEPFERDLRANDERRRLLQAIRSALIAADAAGSGIIRAGNDSVTGWINRNSADLLTGDFIDSQVIARRVHELEVGGKWQDRNDGKKGWNDFQLDCDQLPSRALLLAPCGSGKTLAAWRWVAARLKEVPTGHAVFLYPTRATAREGFKDYVSWAPESDAALMHGTSSFDLDGMFENSPESDDRRGRNFEAERRLFSLAYWSRRIFSATVDQFLAFMQYGYGPMCMLPVLSNSVVVIDEVHSFDRNMFSALKDFLRNFDVPVLCMTATLPETRRNELVECGLHPPQKWPSDLQSVADTVRYRLKRVDSRELAEHHVHEALAAGKRVLWVVNQVRRAHQIIKSFIPDLPPADRGELRTTDNVPVVCYHSRFRLSDRVRRHADTMQYLKADWRSAALGVTTQVCEMSLDIDVDLLVTEDCPVTSLVQRMGRCNRQRNARSLSNSGTVIVYPPDDDDNLPYDDADLTGLSEFLGAVDRRELSQTDLDNAMRDSPCPPKRGDVSSRFLDSGAYAVSARDDDGEDFRDSNDFNRQCILEDDVPAFGKATTAQQAGFILPVPRRFAVKHGDTDNETQRPEIPSYLGVAPTANYHIAIGFSDNPAAEWSLNS